MVDATRGMTTDAGEDVMNDTRVAELAELIRDVPDFPKEGIVFKDITTLLKNPEGFQTTVDLLVAALEGKGIDRVVAMESRGFIFGTPVALRIGAGFVPVRKPGKLPAETVSESYELEYGTDTLEIHKDAIEPGMKVAIIDDLLATGGTAEAAVRLVRSLGGDVAAALFVIELDFLDGRKRLEGVPVQSLIHY
jgi:adenine phosphoribosyltransferase